MTRSARSSWHSEAPRDGEGVGERNGRVSTFGMRDVRYSRAVTGKYRSRDGLLDGFP